MEALAAVALAALAIMLAVAARRAKSRPADYGGEHPWDDDASAGVREPRPVGPRVGSAAAEVDPALEP